MARFLFKEEFNVPVKKKSCSESLRLCNTGAKHWQLNASTGKIGTTN